MSVGRRRIRGTSIVCIHSLVIKLVVVVTNSIPQAHKVRRLSVHWKNYVSLYIISLSLCVCLYCVCIPICVCYVYSFAWRLRTSLEAIRNFVYSKSASASLMVFL